VGYRKNIVLIGFMGCGKSTLGSRLAYRIKYSFIDSDRKIEEDMNLSINEIFEKYGEEYFRKLENETIKKISKIDKQVIATGGGVIKNPDNIAQLKKRGIVLYLSATPEHIYSNLKNDNTRPLLQNGDKLKIITDMLGHREELYKKYADVIIELDESSINDTVEKIIERIEGLIL